LSQETETKVAKFRQDRREFLRKARLAGFVVPLIVTFSMSGLMTRPAAAQSSNMS